MVKEVLNLNAVHMDILSVLDGLSDISFSDGSKFAYDDVCDLISYKFCVVVIFFIPLLLYLHFLLAQYTYRTIIHNK